METLRRIRKWLDRELAGARPESFRIVAAFAALLLALSLLEALFSEQPVDAKLVAVLVPALLTAAFLAAFGKDVAGRIKKIGPIEILEAHKDFLGLDEISADVLKSLGQPLGVAESLEKTPLSPNQKLYYEEGGKLLTYLKLSGTEPKSGPERKVFWELLFLVGRTAHTQLEWPLAIRWLEHLERLSDGDYRAAEVSNLLAFSNLFAALQGEEKNEALRARGFKIAADRLNRLAARRELLYKGYFWLAYAQDALGLWYEATKSHHEALKRRPRFAPSRYNLAICLLKLEKARGACRQLQAIRLDDEQVGDVIKGVPADTEMRDLTARVADPETRRRLLSEVARLKGNGA
jgi:hypothetical protein